MDILIWNKRMKEKLTVIKVGGKIVEEETTLRGGFFSVFSSFI